MKALKNYTGKNTQLQHDGDGRWTVFLIKIFIIGIISLLFTLWT